jgi:hypothetical protein
MPNTSAAASPRLLRMRALAPDVPIVCVVAGLTLASSRATSRCTVVTHLSWRFRKLKTQRMEAAK